MAQRVVSPVNLKERIAALQQRAGSTSPPASTSLSASQSSLHSIASSPSPTTAGSGNGLRERIAKFEGKGGVPVPRGSFGLGAAPSREAKLVKRGELYGNRIPSAMRQPGSLSPPPKRSGLGVGLAPPTDGRRSVSTSGLDGADEISVRKRCVSSPLLQSFEQPASAGAGSLSFRDESSGAVQDEISLELAQDATAEALTVSEKPQTPPPNRLKRSSTISGGDAMCSPVLVDLAPLPSSPSPCPAPDSPSLSLSSQNSITESSTLVDSASAPGSAPDERTSPTIDAVDIHSDLGFSGTHAAATKADSVMDAVSRGQDDVDEHVDGQELLGEGVDDDLSKTPVIATFSAPSDPLPSDVEDARVTKVLQALTITRDSSPIPSPTTADFSDVSSVKLEIGERAFAEPTKYVVIPPSVSSASILAEAAAVDDENESERPSSSVCNGPAQGEKAATSINATSNGSVRREATSPVITVLEEKYVEPVMELTTGPKSFHAVVHGKKQLSNKPDPLRAAAAQPSKSYSQIAVVRQSLTERFGPDMPTSPDLLDLLSRALTLEQQLLGGDDDTRKATAGSSASQGANITFPRVAQSDASYLPSPPLPSPPPNVPVKVVFPKNRTSTRTESSWSSSLVSSEDSASVITPPSPTFDLITPPLYADMKFTDTDLSKLQIGIPEAAVNIEHHDDEERRSIGSVLSSPGRSARKKLLSMSRTLSRTSRSNGTLPSHDDAASTNSCDSFPTSVSPSRPSESDSDNRSHFRGHYRENSLFVPLTITPSTAADISDQARPILTQTASTTYMTPSSPLDATLFDAFPAVPSAYPPPSPGARSLAALESGASSPPPPTPPSKSPTYPMSPALPLTPPTPPQKDLSWQRSMRGLSSAERPLPHPAGSLLVPHDFSASIAESPTRPRPLRPSSSTSVLSVFSRSISSRSTKSHISGTASIQSRRRSTKHDVPS